MTQNHTMSVFCGQPVKVSRFFIILLEKFFIREGKAPKNVKLMLLAVKNISEMYFIKITFTQY